MIDAVGKFAKVNARVALTLENTEGLEGDELRTKLKELREGGLLNQEILNQYLKVR